MKSKGKKATQPSALPDSFGKRLKLRREELGMSQLELGIETGIAQPTLSSYEMEKTSPSVSMLRDLADILNVSADWLIGRCDK